MAVVCASEDELRVMAKVYWWLAAAKAVELGMDLQADLLRPPAGENWREIVERIAELQDEIERRERELNLGGA